jgi:hypothetical protein
LDGKEHLSMAETIGVCEDEELPLAEVERCLRERVEGLLEEDLEAEQLSSGKPNRWRGRVTARVEDSRDGRLPSTRGRSFQPPHSPC